MIARIASLTAKEFIQLTRDRAMLLLILLFPVAQLILLAAATGRSVSDQALAVVDYDRSAGSRGLILALDNATELAVRQLPSTGDDAEALVQGGQAVAALVIPPGYGAALASGAEAPQLQLLIDGSSSVVARTVRSAVQGIVNDQASGRPGGASIEMPVVLVTAAAYNPALNSRLFTIPAQVGFIVYQVTLAVASLTFARERELGTLEGLLVTPLRRIELITGKAILAWIAGGLDFLLMLWVVRRFFDIPLRGSFLLLFGFSLLFVAVEIAYGVILSSFARTQQQAILYVFVLAMIDIALSGYLVAVKNMPQFFAAVAQASPLQHYLVAIRGIMLKGAGLAELWPQAAGLAAIGLVVGVVAVRTAARRLE